MAVFDRAVREYRANKGVRKLQARSHLAAMIMAQLTGALSLRETEMAMAADAGELRRLRISPAARSTLADANATRPPETFEAVARAVINKLSPTQRRKAEDAIRLLDATRLALPAGSSSWAHFAHGNICAKLHVVYDPGSAMPLFYEISPGNVNDITVAKASLAIERYATYVFDLGYYDFGFWASLDAEHCRFVTRLKDNTRTTVIEERAAPDDTNILSDHVVRLPERLAKSRKNPFAKPGRAIKVELETGKIITLFTNDLEMRAEDIAGLYKTRWLIELFFKSIKQNLKIKHFLGTTANAVRLQIAAAIIVYLVLRFLHKTAKTTKCFSTFVRAFSQCLFKRIKLAEFVERLERGRLQPPPPCSQLALEI